MAGSECKFRHAVVGLDLSEASKRLVDWLPYLKSIGTRELTLVHVVPVDVLEHVAAGYMVDKLREELVREASSQLEKYASKLREAGFKVNVAPVEVGVPAQKIVEAARRAGADYIVVGSAGRGWLRRILLGSTAEEVVHYADRPVLVSKMHRSWEREASRVEAPFNPFQGPIVAAIDFDELLDRVVCCAAAIGGKVEAELVLLHVLGEGEDEEEAARRLSEIASKLRDRRVRVRHVIVRGRPGKTIVRIVGELKASLVLLGPHGGRGILGWMLGTTAEAVIRRSTAHVLVCR